MSTDVQSEFKIVLVGDGQVGKTCLALTYQTGTFPQDYIPMVADHFYSKESGANLLVCDTTPREEYDRVRHFSYPGAKTLLLCFSVIQRFSFKNISDKWLVETNHLLPDAVKVIVGCKTDLRNDPTVLSNSQKGLEQPVQKEEGVQLARDLGLTYVECSAVLKEGLKEVFQTAMTAPPPEKRSDHSKACSLL